MARRQPLVVEPEQFQSPLDVLLTPDRVAYPPDLRQDVMQLRLPFGHELFPHPYRKREVRQPAPVQVPDLVPVHPEPGPVEPVRLRLHPRPSFDLSPDVFRDAHLTPVRSIYLAG